MTDESDAATRVDQMRSFRVVNRRIPVISLHSLSEKYFPGGAVEKNPDTPPVTHGGRENVGAQQRNILEKSTWTQSSARRECNRERRAERNRAERLHIFIYRSSFLRGDKQAAVYQILSKLLQPEVRLRANAIIWKNMETAFPR